jgi:hypothetical protein
MVLGEGGWLLPDTLALAQSARERERTLEALGIFPYQASQQYPQGLKVKCSFWALHPGTQGSCEPRARRPPQHLKLGLHIVREQEGGRFSELVKPCLPWVGLVCLAHLSSLQKGRRGRKL